GRRARGRLGRPLGVPRWRPARGGTRAAEEGGGTGPRAGPLQPKAGGATISAAAAIRETSIRISKKTSVVLSENAISVAGLTSRCQIRLQRPAIEAVPCGAGEPGDEIGRLPARNSGGHELVDRRDTHAFVRPGDLPGSH